MGYLVSTWTWISEISDLTGSPKMLNGHQNKEMSNRKNPGKWQVELPEPSSSAFLPSSPLHGRTPRPGPGRRRRGSPWPRNPACLWGPRGARELNIQPLTRQAAALPPTVWEGWAGPRARRDSGRNKDGNDKRGPRSGRSVGSFPCSVAHPYTARRPPPAPPAPAARPARPAQPNRPGFGPPWRLRALRRAVPATSRESIASDLARVILGLPGWGSRAQIKEAAGSHLGSSLQVSSGGKQAAGVPGPRGHPGLPWCEQWSSTSTQPWLGTARPAPRRRVIPVLLVGIASVSPWRGPPRTGTEAWRSPGR
jgi:hypothetical protein